MGVLVLILINLQKNISKKYSRLENTISARNIKITFDNKGNKTVI